MVSMNPNSSQVFLRKTSQNSRPWFFSSKGDRFFCAGGNLRFYADMKGRRPGILANRKIRAQLKQLAKLPIPTLVLVDGECYGGGVELLSCFDFVYSTPTSKFGLWQRRIGLTFGWGGGARLLKRISEHKLKQLCLVAQTLDASEAQSLHIVDQVVDRHELQSLAHKWARNILSLPMEPVSGIKELNPHNEVTIFEKLWMNLSHKAVLKKFK